MSLKTRVLDVLDTCSGCCVDLQYVVQGSRNTVNNSILLRSFLITIALRPLVLYVIFVVSFFIWMLFSLPVLFD